MIEADASDMLGDFSARLRRQGPRHLRTRACTHSAAKRQHPSYCRAARRVLNRPRPNRPGGSCTRALFKTLSASQAKPLPARQAQAEALPLRRLSIGQEAQRAPPFQAAPLRVVPAGGFSWSDVVRTPERRTTQKRRLHLRRSRDGCSRGALHRQARD